MLTPKHQKQSKSEQDLRPTPTLSEKFAQQDKRDKINVFLGKAKESISGSPMKQKDGGVPSDNQPNPPKKLSMADIIIAASAAKTVKLKSRGRNIL